MLNVRLISLLLAAALLAAVGHPRGRAKVVALWTFEAAAVPLKTGATTGPSIAATTGSGSFFGHSTTNFTWQNAAGNGSNNGYEGDGLWSPGAYWQFDFSTTG